MKANVERIAAPLDASFVCRRRREASFPFFWHRHQEVELTFIAASRGRRFVGDSIADYGPGDMVLLGRNLPHTWHCERVKGAQADATFVQFAEDFQGPEFFARPEWTRVRGLLERARQGLQFDGRTRERAGERLLGMPRLDPARRLIALLEILEELARARPCAVLSSLPYEAPHLPDEARIDRVCRFVNARFREEIAQPEAAKIAHLSAPAFSRFFKRATGRSFTGYVNALRVGHACRELIETERSVAEIAFDAGFGNLSNFNRRFRELKGLNPRDFRRQFHARGAPAAGV